MANLERGIPIRSNTVFALASITKSFTAMSVALAAERGLLSLDDEVQKYIPEWSDRGDHITIRHLLTHTSGLRDGFTLLGWAPAPAGDMNDAIVEILARQRGVNFPPRTQYQYDNGGYALLASLIKRATAQSLPAFADANIFTPLRMAHSGFQSDTTVATGYSRKPSGWHEVPNGNEVVGNAGMYSTVEDLLRWERNFDDVQVGTAAMMAEMQNPPVLQGGNTSSYGFGLAMGQYRGVPTVEHSGGDFGTATKVVRFPRQQFAIAVLCNEDSIVMGGMARVNPDVFTNAIADIYLSDSLGPNSSSLPPAPPTPITLSGPELAEKTGLYRILAGDRPVLTTVVNDTLMLRSYLQDDFDIALTPVGTNRFLLQNIVPMVFVPSTSKTAKKWLIGDGANAREAQLVTQTVSPATARSYAGRYRSEELGATYTVEIEGAGLSIKSDGRAVATVAPFLPDIYAGDVAGVVKFSRNGTGTVTGFTLNRDVARGVRFDRVK